MKKAKRLGVAVATSSYLCSKTPANLTTSSCHSTPTRTHGLLSEFFTTEHIFALTLQIRKVAISTSYVTQGSARLFTEGGKCNFSNLPGQGTLLTQWSVLQVCLQTFEVFE